MRLPERLGLIGVVALATGAALEALDATEGKGFSARGAAGFSVFLVLLFLAFTLIDRLKPRWVQGLLSAIGLWTALLIGGALEGSSPDLLVNALIAGGFGVGWVVWCVATERFGRWLEKQRRRHDWS